MRGGVRRVRLRRQRDHKDKDMDLVDRLKLLIHDRSSFHLRFHQVSLQRVLLLRCLRLRVRLPMLMGLVGMRGEHANGNASLSDHVNTSMIMLVPCQRIILAMNIPPPTPISFKIMMHTATVAAIANYQPLNPSHPTFPSNTNVSSVRELIMLQEQPEERIAKPIVAPAISKATWTL